MATRIGPFELGSPQAQWGSGWFSAVLVDGDEYDLPGKTLLRAALPGETPSLQLESARRRRLRSPHVPELLRSGLDEGRAWLSYRAITAVKIDLVLDEPVPVPLALAWATSLAEAMTALADARYPPANDGDTAARTPIAPSFDELLVSKTGDLVVTTPPPGTRMALPGLLVVPRRDRFLLPPEGVTGSVAGDIYAVGSVLHQLLTAAEPFASTSPQDIAAGALLTPREHVDDIPARVDDVVRRAMARDPALRFESMDDFVEACARAADDYPPLEPAERAAFVRERAGWRLDEAERSLT